MGKARSFQVSGLILEAGLHTPIPTLSPVAPSQAPTIDEEGAQPTLG